MTPLPQPTPALIAEHLRDYEAGPDGEKDAAVAAVVHALPRNDQIGPVLAKVVVLNTLYSTNVFGVRGVALAIVRAGIDPMLADGAPEVLHILADHVIGGRRRNHFSFATKFAHWHRPEVYPVFDRFVRDQLMAYQQQDQFATFRDADLRTAQFMSIMEQFRRFYGLEGCSLRAVDKWLWRQGQGTPTG